MNIFKFYMILFVTASIIFTNLSTQNQRYEAEESMSYADFVRLTGSAEAANYIIARTGS